MCIVLTYKKFINLNTHNKPIIGTKNYKNKNLTKDTTRKTNHKKCKPKCNPKLKTQKHKAKTQ